MILAEPPRSRFDVEFSVGSIPVRVHPFFWLAAAFLGLAAGGGALNVVLWTVAMFVSIMVHELGHALVAKAHGWPPHVVLHGMGGLAIYTPTNRKRVPRAAIAFSGPGAGFLLGGVMLAGIVLSGHSVTVPVLDWTIGEGPPIARGRLGLFIYYMLFMNIFWGIINLAPIQPLDGGAIAQTVLEKFRPRDALALSLKVSLGAAVLLALVGMVLWKSTFMAIMFGILAFESWQLLQQAKAHGWA